MLLKSESSSLHSRLLSDKTSFAWVAATRQWPENLTQIIDAVAQRGYHSKDDGGVRRQAHGFIQQLSALKYELTHNKTIEVEDEVYKAQLEAMGRPKWMDVPWIFAESVMYRRISAIFPSPDDFKDFDHPVKDGQLAKRFPNVNDPTNFAQSGPWSEDARVTRDTIRSHAERFQERMERIKEELPAAQLEERKKEIFLSLCEESLWATATERPFLPSQTSQDFLHRSKSSEDVLVDDLQFAYDVLRKARGENKAQRKVDIVLNKAGLEMSRDLLLAVYLLEAQLATHVVLHAPRPLQDPSHNTSTYLKDFAMIHDLPPGELIDQKYPPSIKDLIERWRAGSKGALTIQQDSFWSMWYSFRDLWDHAPKLLRQFQQSELVIVKGDFNYRKLTADADWPTATSFQKAIGPMGGEYGVRTLALRTIASDTVVGLRAGQDEVLKSNEQRHMEPKRMEQEKRMWAWYSRFAMMQFCDGKGT